VRMAGGHLLGVMLCRCEGFNYAKLARPTVTCVHYCLLKLAPPDIIILQSKSLGLSAAWYSRTLDLAGTLSLHIHLLSGRTETVQARLQ
jgi:hypothetical protein